ncbi:LysR substrate-binding domain-containing protein [Microbacterium betulae]|uniref:LysR substrate-binding domain-containing protein n=1 Tax=Microbacterium betulae TaxID=2981139 RepID=A0AA97I535_9MICO|nr:LysR substrate-binding domain-containing protein [Microbacterium sp. AB]WOF21642.1 LysR substrate-binding domain-containing protein [Microbacterium sp. AB]
MLDVHRLRVFRSVVASASVQAAAVSLGYTPSAVNQHITALQRETGLTLFTRSGRGLRATPAGIALAAEVDEVLARLGRVEALVTDLRAGRTGTISIAYFASVRAAWLPSLVRRLGHDFPGVRLDLRLSESPPDDPAERADVHLVVARGDFSPEPGFVSRHLLDDPYVAVVPDGHELARREEVELAELANEQWIDNDFARGWCRRVLLDACAAVGYRPAFRVEAHDYPAALAFVAAGIGITVLPGLGAARTPTGVSVITVVRPTPMRSIHAVVREEAAHLPPVEAALELLSAAADPTGGTDREDEGPSGTSRGR